VSNIIKNQNNGPGDRQIEEPVAKRNRPRSECTPDIVEKVKKYITSDDPPRQCDMARRLGSSQTSFFNIIHQDLNQQKKVKPKVHHLTQQRMIAQRKDRALPFYNLIKNEQYEYILTLDEAMLPLHYMNGKREFFLQV
jgi:hypothetical protein